MHPESQKQMAKKKLTIRLTPEQAGPFPVSTESIWFEEMGSLFKVKNIPFFVDDISFDDVVALSRSSDDIFEVVNVVKRSGNSTVWLYFKQEGNEQSVISKIKEIGCGIESGVIDHYYAVNVPRTCDFALIQEAIDAELAEERLIVDYPSIQHFD